MEVPVMMTSLIVDAVDAVDAVDGSMRWMRLTGEYGRCGEGGWRDGQAGASGQ
jgi:hypothetical protein